MSRVAVVEERVDRLEMMLEQLTLQVDRTERQVNEMGRQVDKLARRIDETGRQVNETGHQVDKTERQVDRTSRAVEQLSIDTQKWKSEMNKRWGDLARKFGTIVEDVVAPALPDLIKRIFDMEIDDMMVRRKRRKGERREEFDIIADVGEMVFVVEVKSQYKAGDIDDFSQKLVRFEGLFPEYKEKRIIGVIASLYLDEGVIRYATRKEYYAMGMKGDYMDFLNAEEIRG